METTFLFPNPKLLASQNAGGTQQASALPRIARVDAVSTAAGTDQVVILRPRPLLWLRKTLVCGWSGYLLISPWSSSFKLDCCLVSLVLLGTFRTTTVSARRITWKYRFGFLPFYTRHLSLKDQCQIVTGWEERSGLGEALLLGLWGACVAPLADWLCPWPGGSYRLWVKNSHGKQILVWRGRVGRNFHRNHKLLSQATRLPSFRAPTSESRAHWLEWMHHDRSPRSHEGIPPPHGGNRAGRGSCFLHRPGG